MRFNEQDKAATEKVFDVTLVEWCAARSSADKRVELIAAFYKSQAEAGTTRALQVDYDANFASFINRPA
jgi:hypothetical protein